MNLKKIGFIETAYLRIEDCPKNTRFSEGYASLYIDNEYIDGLLDIESASHLIVLYWLDKADRSVYQAKTVRADGKLRGCFATRTPNRPNPIGFSVVKLLEKNENKLLVSGLDCISGTIILDIKPYIANNDAFNDAIVSWQNSVQ